MSIKKYLCLLVLTLGTVTVAGAQDVAVKTNVLNLSALNANVGVEIGLAPRWTLDLSGDYNGWTVSGRKWKHWLMQPEARYWFCNRFAGQFVGFHALGGVYNFGNLPNNLRFLGSNFSKLTDRRYQGWGIGAGIAYGYAWVLGEHWNLETEIGAGWVYTRYDVFPCAECGTKLESDQHHHYLGPTRAAVKFVYLF